MPALALSQRGPRSVPELEKTLDVAVEIARRGYAAPVIRLAAVRQGFGADSAEVVVISAQRLASLPVPLALPPPIPRANPALPPPYPDTDGLAALWVLRKLSRFLIYVVLALGGGAVVGLGLGWEAGFSEGTADSLRRIDDLLREVGLR